MGGMTEMHGMNDLPKTYDLLQSAGLSANEAAIYLGMSSQVVGKNARYSGIVFRNRNDPFAIPKHITAYKIRDLHPWLDIWHRARISNHAMARAFNTEVYRIIYAYKYLGIE